MQKLTNIQKYAIQGMLGDEKTPEDIAKELNVTVTVVNNYISKLKDSIEKIEGNINSFGFVKQTDAGRKGIVVMTTAASERGDEARKKTRKTKSSRTRNHIHIINKNIK